MKTEETSPVRLRKARKSDMPFITEKAQEWDLDISASDPKQFLVAADEKDHVIGFGRIKEYGACFELGTVGVRPDYRSQGIGRLLVRELISMFPSKDVWIATDLVDYFKQFGFKVIADGPEEIKQKISQAHCCKARQGVQIMLLTKPNQSADPKTAWQRNIVRTNPR